MLNRLRLVLLLVLCLPVAAMAASSATVTTEGGGGASLGAVTNAGTFAVQSTSEPATGVEDAAETAGGTLKMVGSVRRDAAAASAGTTGENATINTDALGQLWARSLDPCSGVAKTYLAISIAAATTTELTPSLAGASTHYYVCSIHIVSAAANNVALVDDDSDGCGSVTSGLAGGTTAATGWNFAANGGIALGNGMSSVARTAGTNRVICLVTSGSGQVSGTLVVVAAP